MRGKNITAVCVIMFLTTEVASGNTRNQNTRGKLFNADNVKKNSMLKKTNTEHISAVHKGMTFECKDCEYTTSRQQNLIYHNQIIHLEIRYSCDQCEYAARSSRVLVNHKKVVHENKV